MNGASCACEVRRSLHSRSQLSRCAVPYGLILTRQAVLFAKYLGSDYELGCYNGVLFEIRTVVCGVSMDAAAERSATGNGAIGTDRCCTGFWTLDGLCWACSV